MVGEDQLNPSKWPLRILSPIGEGALRGLVGGTARVADRRGLLTNGAPVVGEVAEFGGGLGGFLALVSSWGLPRAGPPSESLRKRLLVRSVVASGLKVAGGCVKRLANETLARLA
jgi:hypothetical protein